MRPSQQKNRMRGRGRKQPNPLSRNFESNGPDVKIRGNAAHIAEKYTALARDAASAGDTVMAENYLQHAEHYNRIVAMATANANRFNDEQSAHMRVQSSDPHADLESEEFQDEPDQAPQPQIAEPAPPPAASDETKEQHVAEEPQKAPAEEPPQRTRRPRRTTRRAEAPRPNGNGAAVEEEEFSADGRKISSDAAKLPGSLLGMGAADEAPGPSGED